MHQASADGDRGQPLCLGRTMGKLNVGSEFLVGPPAMWEKVVQWWKGTETRGVWLFIITWLVIAVVAGIAFAAFIYARYLHLLGL